MKRLLLATAALLALTGAARAETFTAIDYTVTGAQAVYINPPGENVYAGQIHLIGNGGTFADVWCLDVNDGIVKPYTYNVSTFTSGSSFPGLNNPLSDAQVRQIAALMFLGNATNTGIFSDAVVQLAIWKAEYGAGFSTPFLDGATQGLVTSALLDTEAGGIYDRGDLTLRIFSDDPAVHSQAFGQVQVAAVPEPATWAMMILGFFGVGGVAMAKRRREGGAAFRVA
jgi:hypothetical protein